MNDVSQASYVRKQTDEAPVVAGQAASAGLGVALAASIAGLAITPATLAGLGVGVLFYGAKWIAATHHHTPHSER